MCTQKRHNIYCEGQLTTSRQKVKEQKIKGASKSKEQYGASKNIEQKMKMEKMFTML